VGRPPPAGSGRDGRWRGPSGGAAGHPRVAQEGGARGQQKPHTGGEKNISFAHTCKLGQWLSAISRRNLGRKIFIQNHLVPAVAGGVAVGSSGTLAGSRVCAEGTLRFGGGWRPDSGGDEGGSGW
jgi:hypothetical protein